MLERAKRQKRIDMKSSYVILSKGVAWRILSIVTLAIVTYAFTGDWRTTTVVTVFANLVFLVLYYFNEYVWAKQERPKNKVTRSILKMFTYVTVMGMGTMFLITYAITRDIQVMTNVTVVYVTIKHIMYIFHELCWNKIEVQVSRGANPNEE